MVTYIRSDKRGSDGMATAVICLILLVICILGVKSYLKRLSGGCCGGSVASVKAIAPRDSNLEHFPYSYEMKIEGMQCRQCSTKIENAFHEREGFCAKVNIRKKSAVIHSKEEAETDMLKHIVVRAGYQVTEIKRLL